MNTKNMDSAWSHGVGQALIESHDVKTGTISTSPGNLMLILAGLGLDVVHYQQK